MQPHRRAITNSSETWGLTKLVDYRTTEFEDVVDDINVMLDPVGGDSVCRSVQFLQRGGHLHHSSFRGQ